MIALVTLALIPFSAIWSGFALSQLWGWFVVPFGAPAIGIAHAIGIYLTMACFKTIPRQTEVTDKEKTDAFVHAVVIAVLKPGFLLIFGLIAEWWMP